MFKKLRRTLLSPQATVYRFFFLKQENWKQYKTLLNLYLEGLHSIIVKSIMYGPYNFTDTLLEV